MISGNIFARLFGLSEADSDSDGEEKQVKSDERGSDGRQLKESRGVTLRDAVDFVAELQSYYYSDICKMQSDLMLQNSMTQSHVNFLNNKINQEQLALSQIDEVLNSIQGNEREYQSVWGKSVYSFYSEVEGAKLEGVQKTVFDTLVRLYAINTKPELSSVILSRLERYKSAWNIEGDVQIPESCNAILIDEEDGVWEYQFGNFTKRVIPSAAYKALSSTQLDKIRKMDFEVDAELSTGEVWVYVSAVTRVQLNRMNKTCFIDNSWEYIPGNEDHRLYLDVVNLAELDEYLKGVLQIVLSQRNYAVISIVIPTDNVRRIIGEVRQDGNKVEICRKFLFYWRQRSSLYDANLLTARLSRRDIPEKLCLVPYRDFKKAHF